MQSSRNFARASWIIVLLTWAGCATTDFPRNLPEAEEAVALTGGRWVVVYPEHAVPGDGQLPLEGELIAIDRDTLFVFTGSDLQACACSDVASATLYVTDYPMDPSLASTWVLLGTLSTLSHGILLAASAPVWLIFGSIAASGVVHDADQGDLRWPEDSWEALGAFARFPQGLGEEIDRSSLRPVATSTRPPKRDQ